MDFFESFCGLGSSLWVNLKTRWNTRSFFNVHLLIPYMSANILNDDASQPDKLAQTYKKGSLLRLFCVPQMLKGPIQQLNECGQLPQATLLSYWALVHLKISIKLPLEAFWKLFLFIYPNFAFLNLFNFSFLLTLPFLNRFLFFSLLSSSFFVYPSNRAPDLHMTCSLAYRKLISNDFVFVFAFSS